MKIYSCSQNWPHFTYFHPIGSGTFVCARDICSKGRQCTDTYNVSVVFFSGEGHNLNMTIVPVYSSGRILFPVWLLRMTSRPGYFSPVLEYQCCLLLKPKNLPGNNLRQSKMQQWIKPFLVLGKLRQIGTLFGFLDKKILYLKRISEFKQYFVCLNLNRFIF